MHKYVVDGKEKLIKPLIENDPNVLYYVNKLFEIIDTAHLAVGKNKMMAMFKTKYYNTTV